MNEVLGLLVENVLLLAALAMWVKYLMELASCRLRYEYRRRH